MGRLAVGFHSFRSTVVGWSSVAPRRQSPVTSGGWTRRGGGADKNLCEINVAESVR
jgi:hypothetical protein